MEISKEIQSRFKDHRSMAMVNILYTANWFRDLYKESFKEFNLLPQHYNVLRIVAGKSPAPSSPSDIKKVMLDKGPDITRLIDKLVKMEYVMRSLCKTNRRSMEIRISESGLSVLEKMTQVIDSKTKQHFDLDEEDALKLSQLLDKARKHS